MSTASQGLFARDPLLPWLLSIKEALDDYSSKVDLDEALLGCINNFRNNEQYRDDPRLLKIWFLYLERDANFKKVFKEMEMCEICFLHSSLYELYAGFLEAKELWQEAHTIYKLGILRKAEPLERLSKAHALFLDRMLHRLNLISNQVFVADCSYPRKTCTNPWATSTLTELWKKISNDIVKYDGYHSYTRVYSGKVALSMLRNSSRNKVMKIGTSMYQIKGCAGKGGFAQVYKAFVDNDANQVVALKIQKPAFPWEFYMYRQLDQRITTKQRSGFGYAHKIHVYSDCSMLVCDYLFNGTLQDVINSYVVIGKSMEESLCIYYTIEMLHLLETLHSFGIIHGDFKPDNLLIRYPSDGLLQGEFVEQSHSELERGLCLVDWGRGIDLHLFPPDMEFEGDCRTSGFRCVEMQENRPWKFQVDTYGLCVVVHMMLHGSYMEIEKKPLADGSYIYLPKTPFKRYHRAELWMPLFEQLLNTSGSVKRNVLSDLMISFQDYLHSNEHLLRKLKDLLVKQKLSLCSS